MEKNKERNLLNDNVHYELGKEMEGEIYEV